MTQQFKRRALQLACIVGVIFGVCGCVAQPQQTASAQSDDQRPDPRMAAPRSLSMGAGDAMGQSMFGRPMERVATIDDGE